MIVFGVLVITVFGGVAIAMLIDQPIFGAGIVRILAISPFFVMPGRADLEEHDRIPLRRVRRLRPLLGLPAVDWFGSADLSIIIIVAVAAVRDADPAHFAASRSTASRWRQPRWTAPDLERFVHLTIPHMAAPSPW